MIKYLKIHKEKYPLMTIEDIFKLYYQAILGPSHLNIDSNKMKENLLIEYKESLNNSINYDLIEYISDSYVRIYIKPYYEKFKDFDLLIKLFIKSNNAIYTKEKLENELKKLITEANKEDIMKYIEQGMPVMRHSQIYKENYHPHYLVIKREFIGELEYEE